jgi:hypothetical protein
MSHLTLSSSHSSDSEDHETLDIKERTSTYYLYVSSHEDAHEVERERRLLQKLGLSFFLFGLINNGE